MLNISRSLPKSIPFLTLVLLLCACASEPRYSPLASTTDMIDKALEDMDTRASEASPTALDQVIGEETVDDEAAIVKEEQRFDVSVNNIPAKTFFTSLVSDSGTNVVAEPELGGSISLELNNVTVQEVLDVARDIYGYEYKKKGNIYIIYARKMRTQVFPINYIDIQRVGVTDTNVAIGKINSSDDRNTTQSNNNQEENVNLLAYLEEAQAGASQGDNTGLSAGSRVQTLNKTNFWGTLKKTLAAIVGGEQAGRMVVTNTQAGLVIVKAMPSELRAVRDFLERSQLSVNRQVVLETKILEVRLSDGFEAGINWGAISGQLSMSQTTVGTDSLDRVLFNNTGQTESVVSALLNVNDLTELLKLLETQGQVQVLSSPRISTVNNQKALIRVGSDEFFVTGITSNTTTSAAAISNQPSIELDSFFSGIALDVTPQIAENGDVILHVHPIVTKVTDQQKDIIIGEDIFSLPLAFRDVRESDSIVRAKSGQVVVLGGLMQESVSRQSGKRPGLGSIPVLRHLFRTANNSSVKTELVILMKPSVVALNTWRDLLYEERSLLDEFK